MRRYSIDNYKQLKNTLVYCGYCDDHIDGLNVTLMTNDAEQVEFLCPGCGRELFFPVDRFQFYEIERGED